MKTDRTNRFHPESLVPQGFRLTVKTVNTVLRTFYRRILDPPGAGWLYLHFQEVYTKVFSPFSPPLKNPCAARAEAVKTKIKKCLHPVFTVFTDAGIGAGRNAKGAIVFGCFGRLMALSVKADI